MSSDKGILMKEAQAHSAYQQKQGFFQASGGLQCFWQAWLGDPSFQANMLIHHGLGEHSGSYGSVLDALAKSKINIFSYDARCHAKSQGKRGAIQGLDQLCHDLGLFLAMLKRQYSVEMPLLYGHSMGGLVALAFVLEHGGADTVRALALSAIALRPVLTLPQKCKVFLAACLEKLYPQLVMASGLPLEAISHDEAWLKHIQQDDLRHDRISLSLAMDLLRKGESLLKKAEALTIPVFLSHGDKDRITDCEASREFYENAAKAPKKELKIYPGLFHELHHELPEARASVLADLGAWIEAYIR